MNGSIKLTAAETVSIKKHMSKVESKFKELTNNKKLKLKLQYFNELDDRYPSHEKFFFSISLFVTI